FYTATHRDDANNALNYDVAAMSSNNPELRRYWVFGTERPHVVLNEALAVAPDSSVTYSTPQGSADTVKLWFELSNTLQVPPAGSGLQTLDGTKIQLYMPNLPSAVNNPNPYAPYQVVTALGLLVRPQNDNVVGAPMTVRAQTADTDFAQRALKVEG